MRNENFQISIVIPVYNEGDSLSACLKAIDKLKTKPYEVIVVDNNSTDHSVSVASTYPWVRLIKEKKQGVVHARTSGFNAVKGNIIARIDADTILPSDWIDKLNAIFKDNPDVVAVSGSGDYYDFVLQKIANRIDHWARNYLERRLGDRLFLQGCNMAVTKAAWDKVKGGLCPCDGLHEDLDLGIHLQEAGMKVIYDETLVAGISSRRISNDFSKFVQYSLASPRTYKAHDIGRRRYMFAVIAIVLALYAPGHLAYESYDPELGEFSLKYLASSKFRKSRTDPTINLV